MSKHNDQVYVGHMVDTATKAVSFVSSMSREDFDNNEPLRLAVTHLLQIVGEAARRVSLEFRDAHPEIPWKVIVGMRSKIVHDYFSIDEDVVWETVKTDLAPLIVKLERLLL